MIAVLQTAGRDSGQRDSKFFSILKQIFMELTAIYLKVPEGYIGFVEELPGANTQGETLDEVRSNLQEAVQLVIEANRLLAEESVHNQEFLREPLSVAA
mgnify:CR=1 FL=1